MNVDAITTPMWERRLDHRSAVEIDRAICMVKCYGIRHGAIYLFIHGIKINTALRVLLSENIRIRETFYLGEMQSRQY